MELRFDLPDKMGWRRCKLWRTHCGGESPQPIEICLTVWTAGGQMRLDLLTRPGIQAAIEPIGQLFECDWVMLHVYLMPIACRISCSLLRQRARVGPTLPSGILSCWLIAS